MQLPSHDESYRNGVVFGEDTRKRSHIPRLGHEPVRLNECGEVEWVYPTFRHRLHDTAGAIYAVLAAYADCGGTANVTDRQPFESITDGRMCVVGISAIPLIGRLRT